jgi:hypothetical protein
MNTLRGVQLPSWLAHLMANTFVLVLSAIAIVLLLHFAYQYFLRGLRLRWQLVRLCKRVTGLGDRPPSDVKRTLSEIFSGTRVQFAWKEYEETLHDQYELVQGERRVTAIRATQPAESFINLENIIDPRIGAEYFKHLPGILTGFGIIGTFYGLIQGLNHFDPSLSDPKLLQSNVHGLFGHVEDAFTFSAIAITCAILVTLIEKWLYSSCAKWVSGIAQAIDALFRAGVGEEYLSNLLRASQETATQTRQLKESLVADLKELLTNLTERQIAATQQLSADLGQRIQEGLKEPLAVIAQTVRETAGRQGEAVGHVLEQLMTSFLAQMRETMGGQLGDLSGLMQRSAQAMANVEQAMQGLVTDMQKAGAESTTGVQAAMRDLMGQLTAHQQAQSESVSTAIGSVLGQLQETLTRVAVSQEEHDRKARELNIVASSELKARMATIADTNAAAIAATREALDRVGSVSSDMLDRLSAGAVSVTTAVSGLVQAIERQSRLAAEVTALHLQLRESSQTMSHASTELAGAAHQVGTTSGQLLTAATRLEGVTKLAGTEADARSALLRDLQEVLSKAHAASLEFNTLTSEVRNSLKEGIEGFGTGVSKVLSEHLHSYQKQLGDAVGMLKGALEELAEYASTERA